MMNSTQMPGKEILTEKDKRWHSRWCVMAAHIILSELCWTLLSKKVLRRDRFIGHLSLKETFVPTQRDEDAANVGGIIDVK